MLIKTSGGEGGRKKKPSICCHVFPAFPPQLLPLPVSVWRESVRAATFRGFSFDVSRWQICEEAWPSSGVTLIRQTLENVRARFTSNFSTLS